MAAADGQLEPAPWASTLANPEWERSFVDDGFVVVPFVDPNRLSDLRAAVEPLIPGSSGPFFGLYRNDDATCRHAIDELVRPLLVDEAMGIMADQRIYLCSLLVKFPGAEGTLDLHQDWSFVDESKFTSGVIWFPLEPTDATNGGLRVVPASHRIDVPFRGIPPSEASVARVADEMRHRSATTIATEAGEAIVYDHRLIHGSTANETDRPRVVVALGFLPRAAELVHVVFDGTTTWRHTVTDEFFLDYEPGTTELAGVIASEPVPPSISVVFPAYNEAEGIAAALSDAQAALDELVADGTIAAYEVLVVDDGSTDGTAGIVERVVATNPTIRLLRHARNRGVGAGFSTALAASRSDLILYTDADMPVDLRELREALPLLSKAGVGMVAGCRPHRGGDGRFRELASLAYDVLARVTLDVTTPDVNFPFKLLRRTDAERIDLRSEGALADAELLAGMAAIGRDVESKEMAYRPRQFGTSKTMTPRLLSRLAVELVRYRREGSRRMSAQRP